MENRNYKNEQPHQNLQIKQEVNGVNFLDQFNTKLAQLQKNSERCPKMYQLKEAIKCLGECKVGFLVLAFVTIAGVNNLDGFIHELKGVSQEGLYEQETARSAIKKTVGFGFASSPIGKRVFGENN
jgi:hypothetical protein